MAIRIIRVPVINALGKKGSEKAPVLILKELKKIYENFGKLDLEEIHVDNSNVEEAQALIYKNSKKEFEVRDNVVFVGGDHSLSYSSVKAFNETFGEDSFLIVFDAHADCDFSNKEPTHEEWLRAVLENTGIKGENVFLIGARKMWDVEKDFLKEKGVNVFSDVEDFESFADVLTERVRGKKVYVSLDIDVLDPAFAPGVNFPEALGFSSKELVYLLKRIFHLKELKGFDIVEVVPEKDKEEVTIKIAARILKEFLEIRGR